MSVRRAALALAALALPSACGGGEPARPPEPSKHRSSSGTLPPEAIKSVVRGKSAALQECYLEGTMRDKHLGGGAVTVSFRIAEDGRVEDARLASPGAAELGDPAVRECVRKVFEGLRFPPPKGGTMGVTYPVRFGRE